MKRLLLLTLTLGAFAADPDYRAGIERWRGAREASLKAEDGWLSVAGLFWLEPGDNRIELPTGSTVTVTLHDGRVVLKPDVSLNKPVKVGRLTLLLIQRGGRYAIRLRDPESSMRKEFTGLRWYPIEEKWRIEAKFVPYSPPKKIAFATVVGTVEEMPCPGYVSFKAGEKEYRLEPASEGSGLFFVFRDATSGKTTYGAGRFLNTGPPRNGVVVLDFNQAVNPPCAFTPYATCPIPPKQNRLPIAIAAGELNYGPH